MKLGNRREVLPASEHRRPLSLWHGVSCNPHWARATPLFSAGVQCCRRGAATRRRHTAGCMQAVKPSWTPEKCPGARSDCFSPSGDGVRFGNGGGARVRRFDKLVAHTIPIPLRSRCVVGVWLADGDSPCVAFPEPACRRNPRQPIARCVSLYRRMRLETANCGQRDSLASGSPRHLEGHSTSVSPAFQNDDPQSVPLQTRPCRSSKLLFLRGPQLPETGRFLAGRSMIVAGRGYLLLQVGGEDRMAG